jgi:alanine dehydrogenase
MNFISKELKKMRIAVCKEIKVNEGRVALTPENAKELVESGHDVFFEADCGINSGFSNKDYLDSGAKILADHKDTFDVDLHLRVKEIHESEFEYMHPDLTIFAFFHLTASWPETEVMIKKNVTTIDYEYLIDPTTKKRVVTMSPIAGRLGLVLGLQSMNFMNGGKGILPMGVPGIDRAEISIAGAGDAGMGAIKSAISMGAKVNILLRDVRKLEHLENIFGNQANYLVLNRENILKVLKKSDVFVNCIYWNKLRTDHLIYRTDLKHMKAKSVIIDISCDINGGIETSKVTSHEKPTFVVDDVIHYCVDNIPGAVPYSSSRYLTAQSFPFIRAYANNPKEFGQNLIIKNGVLTHKGEVTSKLIADKFKLKHTYIERVK